MEIKRISLFKIVLPLTEAYQLSYGCLQQLNSVWACLELADGRIGWGESTPLYGYSNATIESVLLHGKDLARKWIGNDAQEITKNIRHDTDGFLFTALITGLEEALGIIPKTSGRVPLVGLVQEKKGESSANAIERARTQGYRSFKVKVGFHELQTDIKRIAAYQESIQVGEKLRIDANQSLEEKQALRLTEICAPDKVEVFEQPYPVKCWKETARLRAKSPVAIMLDESITDPFSLERTINEGVADAVKFKWMKQGGTDILLSMVEKAKTSGMKILFGNGVASGLNNRHEAIFWLRHLKGFGLAGEMNGFVKLMNSAYSDLIDFDQGWAVVSDYDPETIHQTIARVKSETILVLES